VLHLSETRATTMLPLIDVGNGGENPANPLQL
jgi:hypothetical protein